MIRDFLNLPEATKLHAELQHLLKLRTLGGESRRIFKEQLADLERRLPFIVRGSSAETPTTSSMADVFPVCMVNVGFLHHVRKPITTRVWSSSTRVEREIQVIHKGALRLSRGK